MIKPIVPIEEVEKRAEEMGKLKPQHEKFACLYVESGNGTRSYCEAYGLDPNNALDYALAASSSSRLLRNAKVINRINSLLTLQGFTDEGVDLQLNFLLKQHGDLKTKLGAIKEYNTLKGRTQKKETKIFKNNTFNLTQLLDQANAAKIEAKNAPH